MNLRSIISQILDISEEEVTIDTSPTTVSQWTSLNQLTIITTVESEYGVQFTFNEMKQLRDVASFIRILEEKGIENVLS